VEASPGAPIVGVSNLEPRDVRGGHKIYTGSDGTSLHLVFDGSRYLHLC
jgi:hypothetical protein